uniref:MADF domain-containing protein n=1 Tax=Nothobranchius furzeri TaxID=105023 RepID=A0A8C6KL31_NOTFU
MAANMEEKLIVAVTDFPELYNTAAKEYRDIHKKAAAWELVGARINTSGKCTLRPLKGEKAKKRWKNLRDTYMRVCKSLKERKSGSAAGGQKTWKYYQIMSFLEPHLKERVTSGNLTADDLQQEEEIISTLEPRPADSFEATILNRLDNIQAQLKQGDEDELYLQSLLPTFRRLTGARKSMAKVEIMKVLHKIEFGEE